MMTKSLAFGKNILFAFTEIKCKYHNYIFRNGSLWCSSEFGKVRRTIAYYTVYSVVQQNQSNACFYSPGGVATNIHREHYKTPEEKELVRKL